MWTEKLANRLTECDTEKDRLVKLYARGGLTDAKYDRYAAEIAERKRAAEEGLVEARGSASRLSEMQKARRTVVETFGEPVNGTWDCAWRYSSTRPSGLRASSTRT
jgi:hypothetical protein